MGAQQFTNHVEGKDAQAAYYGAVDQARYEYGSNGYNGTISTTNGFEMVANLEQADERVVV